MSEQTDAAAQPTLGDYRVGRDFNPSGNTDVDLVKSEVADLIDWLEAKKAGAVPEVLRLLAHAQTVFEDAAMWAVKAVTKKPREAA